MTDAPERIWADHRLIYPVCKDYPGGTEFVRADIHEAAIAERDDAFIKGMAAGQAAMPKGALEVIDSPSVMKLRAERDALREELAALLSGPDEMMGN